MKQCFCYNLRFGNESKKLLAMITQIITDYNRQGYVLTLRQLYYQLVSRDIIPNKDTEYAKLSKLLVRARMAGQIDWEAIEDRIRVPYLPYYVSGISDAIERLKGYYRLNRQQGQNIYIEVWVEKDALSAILKRVTSYYHLNLMVNRGYSSCTAMYDAAERFRAAAGSGQECNILYVGDHDPSGLDMLRDIKERLVEFGVEVDITPVALTSSQIQEYNPPPNPAKLTDPRSKWYVEKYGNTSWEVDALPPEVLDRLIQTEIKSRLDAELFNKMIEKENADKGTLTRIAKGEGK